MIDIYQSEDIFSLLKNLPADAKPIFGVMSPQHMVEHLSYTIAMSTGRFPQKLHFTEEQAARNKSLLSDPERIFPRGFKAPMLGRNPPPLSFPDLDTAIARLKKELDKFYVFFDGNPESQPIHPAMGPLHKEEWIIFHNRHFTHHFLQFGLVD